MAEAEELCDRILVLKSGKIIADKTPQELANTVSKTTVHLLLSKKAKPLFESYMKEKKISFSYNGDFVKIEIKDHNVSTLLHELAVKDITYSSIFIDKPKLENYFLTLTTEAKEI